MTVFFYRAKQGPQRLVEGLMEADSRAAALEKISGQGCFPLLVEEKREEHRRKGLASFFRRVPSKDVSLFTRQLSDLLESGVPLLRALRVTREQTENALLAEILGEMVSRIEGGDSLSGVLKRYPRVFSPLHVSLARAGEAGGTLGALLQRLSDFTEQEDEIRSKVQTAMAYPVFILAMGLGTVLFLVSFVVPRLADLFADMGQNLPLMTRVVVQASDGVTAFWWGLLVLAAILPALWRGERKEKWKMGWERLVLKVPLWGGLVRKTALARFTRTLGTLLAGHVSLIEALQVSAGVIQNAQMRDQLLQAAKRVQDGASLARSLRDLPDFPVFLSNMVAVGEEGNSLDRSLQKVAATYERDLERTLKVATSLMEPVMILGVGLVIGFIVVALLLPIFQIPTFVK